MQDDILSDKKKRGRPAKGNDNRITVRLSDAQMEKLIKVGKDYYLYDGAAMLTVSTSEVVRKMIDEYPAFHGSMMEYITDTLIDVAHHLEVESKVWRDSGEDDLAHDSARDASALIQVAYLINAKLNYDDNRPDVTKKMYEFTRHAKLIDKRRGVYWDDFSKYTVKKQERKFDSKHYLRLLDSKKP